MQRQSIIVLISGSQLEAWGSLKKACKNHKWSVHTLYRKKLPLYYKGWYISKVPFNELAE